MCNEKLPWAVWGQSVACSLWSALRGSVVSTCDAVATDPLL